MGVAFVPCHEGMGDVLPSGSFLFSEGKEPLLTCILKARREEARVELSVHLFDLHVKFEGCQVKARVVSGLELRQIIGQKLLGKLID